MPVRDPADVVLRVFAARQRGDAGGVLAQLHDDAEATTVGGTEVIRGVDAVLRAMGFGGRDGRRKEVDAHRLEVRGDVVTVHGRIRTFDGGSLADSPACWRFTVEHGRVRRIDAVTASSLVPAA